MTTDLTCECCGHTGPKVKEIDYYDRALGRDSTAYLCTDGLCALWQTARYLSQKDAKDKGD